MKWTKNTMPESLNIHNNIDLVKIDKKVLTQIIKQSEKDAKIMDQLAENQSIDGKLDNLEVASNFLIESLIWTIIKTAGWDYKNSNWWWSSISVDLKQILEKDEKKEEEKRKKRSNEKVG